MISFWMTGSRTTASASASDLGPRTSDLGPRTYLPLGLGAELELKSIRARARARARARSRARARFCKILKVVPECFKHCVL